MTSLSNCLCFVCPPTPVPVEELQQTKERLVQIFIPRSCIVVLLFTPILKFILLPRTGSMEVLEVERIKSEPALENSLSEHAPSEYLYVDHKVKNELVIGPEVLQQAHQPILPTIEVTVKIENGETCKEELIHCNEKPDNVVRTAFTTNDYIKATGINSDKQYWSQKDLFKLQNCFVKLDRLILHKEQYTCNICGKSFSRRSLCTYHMLRHMTEKNTAKKEMSNTTTKKSKNTMKQAKVQIDDTSLKSHDIENPYKCKVCWKQFKGKFQLLNHERTHSGEKPYSCKICGKSFTELSNLRKHERLHSGERPFSCKICKKQFAVKCNLIHHIRTHTDERPYTCNFCCKQFRDHSTFKRHQYIHTKNFTCDICHRQFAQKSHLVGHIHAHATKKSYACDICSKQYGSKNYLTEHKKQHKEHCVCEICDEQFSQVLDLKKHLLSHMARPDLGV